MIDDKILELAEKIAEINAKLCIMQKNVDFIKKLVVIILCAVFGLKIGDFL
ncbi:MAG: hypothetical protein QXP56_07730 [Archaeoglobaceae archaeon]